MEPIIIIPDSFAGKLQAPVEPKINYRLKRISPFLILSFLLVFWVPCSYILKVGTVTITGLILFPFLVTNIIFLDFVIRNFFEGKRKWLIWIIESALSALVIYWFI